LEVGELEIGGFPAYNNMFVAEKDLFSAKRMSAVASAVQKVGRRARQW